MRRPPKTRPLRVGARRMGKSGTAPEPLDLAPGCVEGLGRQAFDAANILLLPAGVIHGGARPVGSGSGGPRRGLAL